MLYKYKPMYVAFYFIVVHRVFSVPINVTKNRPNDAFEHYQNSNEEQGLFQRPQQNQKYNPETLWDINAALTSTIGHNAEMPLENRPSLSSFRQYDEGLTTEALSESFVINEDNTNDYIDLNNDKIVNVIHDKAKTISSSNVPSEVRLKSHNIRPMSSYLQYNTMQYDDMYPASQFDQNYNTDYFDFDPENSLIPHDMNYKTNYWDQSQRHHTVTGEDIPWQDYHNDMNKKETPNNALYQKPHMWTTFVREDFDGEDVEESEIQEMLAMADAHMHPGLSNGIEYDVGESDNNVHNPNMLHQSALVSKQRTYATEEKAVPDEKEMEALRHLIKKYGKHILDIS